MHPRRVLLPGLHSNRRRHMFGVFSHGSTARLLRVLHQHRWHTGVETESLQSDDKVLRRCPEGHLLETAVRLGAFVSCWVVLGVVSTGSARQELSRAGGEDGLLESSPCCVVQRRNASYYACTPSCVRRSYEYANVCKAQPDRFMFTFLQSCTTI